MATQFNIKTLATFDLSDSYGAYPLQSLVSDAAGNLFGTTESGSGAVFEIVNNGTPSAPAYNSPPVTVSVFPSGSAPPNGGLISDAAGNLFGVTLGSPNGYGTVFEIVNYGTPSVPVYGSTPTTLVNFTNPVDGDIPIGGLFRDAAGNLLGVTTNGGSGYEGNVFEIVNNGTPSVPVYSSSPTTVVSFVGSTSGESIVQPRAGLVSDAAGNLFGTTNGGAGYGQVFEIANIGTPSAPVYATDFTVLADFYNLDTTYGAPNTTTITAYGAEPNTAMITDAAGDLFGTTVTGGAYGFGTVFEIVKTNGVYSSAPTTLMSFSGNHGGLTSDAAGDLFGTTDKGGAYGFGLVFEIVNNGTPSAPVYSSTPTTLAYFDSNSSNVSGSGTPQNGGLLRDAAGNIFGTTGQGGANAGGTVFEISAAAPVVTTSLVQDTGSSNTDNITSNAALTGSGDPNALVSFTVDGVVVASTATADGTGTWNYTPTGLADGPHTIVASETDAAGNTGQSIPLAFTLDRTAPILTAVANQTDEATSASGAAATFAATATDVVDGTDPVVFKEGNNVVHSGDTFSLGAHTITASATDAAGNVGSETFTVTVQDTTPPVLTVPGAQTVTVGNALELFGGTNAITIADPTVAAGETFTLEINHSASNGAGFTMLLPQGGSSSYTSNGNLLVTGTLAQINSALTTLDYASNNPGVTPGPDSITLHLTDSVGGSDTKTIAVSVIDAPTLTVPGAQTVTVGNALELFGGTNAITIADPTVAAGETFTLEINHSASNGAGFTMLLPQGGSSSYTSNGNLLVTGTLAQINSALTTLDYASNNPGVTPGPDSITLHLTDSVGGSDTKTIAVSAIDAPTLTVPGAQTVTVGNALELFGGTNAITIADPTVAAGETFTLEINHSASNGAGFTMLLPQGGSSSYTSNGNLLVTGTLAQINSALTTLDYASNNPGVTPGPDSITLHLTDSVGGSDTKTIAVSVIDAPTLTVPGAQTVTVGNALELFGGTNAITIADPTVAAGETFTLEINHSASNGAGFTMLLPQGGSSSYTSNGNLLVTGTLAQINSALTTLDYASNNPGVTPGPDTITLNLTDSVGGSDTKTIAVSVIDAPTLTVPGAQTVTVGNALELFGGTNAITIADPTVAAGETFTLEINHSASNGAGFTMLLPQGGSSSYTSNGNLLVTGTLAQINSALTTLDYASNNPGVTPGPDSITLHLTDSVGGSDTKTIAVSVIDAPTLTVPGAQAVTVGNALELFGGTNAITIADPTVAAGETFTLEINHSASNGAGFTMLLPQGGSSSYTSNGNLLVTGTLAQINSALTTLDYASNNPGVTPGPDTITLNLTDSVGGSDTKTIAVSVIDAPTLTVPGAQTVTVGNALELFGGTNAITIADPTVAAGETFTLEINHSASNGAGFTMLLPQGGSSSYTSNGNLLVTGTLAQINSALTTLDYASNNPGVTPGPDSITLHLTDSVGGSDTKTIAVSVAPAAPTISDLADTYNASYDSGFAVSAGAAVAVTVNGLALNSAQLATDFAKTTSGGVDTYTAPSGAFVGTETIAISATLTDAAGNVSAPGRLTLKPIDTTAPAAPTIASPTYTGTNTAGHWNLSGSAEAGSRLMIYDGTTSLTTLAVPSNGAWGYSTAGHKSSTHDYSVTSTDAAGNLSSSGDYWEGTTGADMFVFTSEPRLASGGAWGNGGTDKIQFASVATLTDSDFANVHAVQQLQLTGASNVTLGAKASAAGITTVITGTGATSVIDSNTGALSVSAGALALTAALTLSSGAGTEGFTVTGLVGLLNAADVKGSLNVTMGAAAASTITTGSGINSITATGMTTGGTLTLQGSGVTSVTDAGTGTLNVNAASHASTAGLTLSSGAGTESFTVTGLQGNLTATAVKGALSVTTGAASALSIATAGGAAVTNMVNASAMTSGENLTLTGNRAATVKVGGNLSASGYSGALNVTATGTAPQTIVTGGGPDTITACPGDILTGGAGADHFVYTSGTNSLASAYDTITDFGTGADKFQIGHTVLAANFHSVTNSAHGNLANDLAAILTTSNFAASGADLVTLTGAGVSDAGTFVVINNNAGVAGFNAAADAVIKVQTGATVNAASFIA